MDGKPSVVAEEDAILYKEAPQRNTMKEVTFCGQSSIYLNPNENFHFMVLLLIPVIL